MAGAPLSPIIVIRGAGEMASAIAWRLYRTNMRRICMLELPGPLAVRRQVSFCTALEGGGASVEGVEAVSAASVEAIQAAWDSAKIAVVLTRDWERIQVLAPDILVDAILAKRNIATAKDQAPLVIALGPGFEAGRDCHMVIETNRGHDLGRIIETGAAEPNTGDPGNIAGFTTERLLRAPVPGRFETTHGIGDRVAKGETIGQVGGAPVIAGLDGILRGLIRNGSEIPAGLKLGDIDPRGKSEYCSTISDKARAIAGSVLEGVMRHLNTPASGQ